jgi:hypothetical protein
MVSFDQISASCHAVIEALHVGQGVPVWNGESIEAAVVTAGAAGAILVGNPCRGDAQGEL